MSIWDSTNLGVVAEKVSWALFAVAAFAFGLRVYCRLRYSRRQGGGLYVDDLITLFCLFVLFIFCILISIAVPLGVGSHYATLSSSDKILAVKWNAILSALTPWICTLPKFAIITTLKRILNYGKKTTIAFWGLALTSQATVVAMMIWGLAQCHPVAYQWNTSIEGGTCASPLIYVDLAYVTYGYSTVLDVFFALYPVPFLMRLNMPLKTRIGVAVSLSISWVGFAISVYKFSIFGKLGALMSTDPSYPLVYLCMTHAAEGSFLIISTSLATIRPLVLGMKKHVANISLVSRSATRYPISGTENDPHTNASHVDSMDYVPLSVQGYGGKTFDSFETSDTKSVGGCGCQRGGTIVVDVRSGTCVDCGGQKSRPHHSTGVTWMEMLKK